MEYVYDNKGDELTFFLILLCGYRIIFKVDVPAPCICNHFGSGLLLPNTDESYCQKIKDAKNILFICSLEQTCFLNC